MLNKTESVAAQSTYSEPQQERDLQSKTIALPFPSKSVTLNFHLARLSNHMARLFSVVTHFLSKKFYKDVNTQNHFNIGIMPCSSFMRI